MAFHFLPSSTTLFCAVLCSICASVLPEKQNPTSVHQEKQYPASVHPSCTAIFHQVWCAGASLEQVPAIEIHPDNTTRYLDLSRNKIQTITWELEMYPFLEYLNMANNSLKILGNEVFNDTHLLEELNLSGNKLTSYVLNDRLFEPLGNLKVLILSYNVFGPRFNLSVLRHMEKLVLLDLDYNNIIFLSTPSDDISNILDNLSELRLRGNFLLDVPQPVWYFVPNLIQLDLSENAFSVLETGSFESLRSLKSLLLTSNEYLRSIKPFAFASLDNLDHADISKCPKLNDIHPFAFGHNATLKTLHLDQNNLTSLDRKFVQWNHVEHVYLAGNLWHCDCDLEWLRAVSSQHSLDGDYKLKDTSSVTCSSPQNINGRLVSSLIEADFNCPESEDLIGAPGPSAAMMELWEVVIVIVSSVIASSCTVFLGMRLFNAVSRDHPEVFGSSQVTYGSLYESHDV